MVAVPFYMTTSNVWEFQFSIFFPTLAILCSYFLFCYSHPRECEVVSHCGFDLRFPSDHWCQASFHIIWGHLIIFYSELAIQILCPLFNFYYWVVKLLYTFRIKTFYQICNLKHFLSLYGLSSHFLDSVLQSSKIFNFE